jgi:uncharacterized protein
MRSQFEARGHTVVHRSVNRAGSIISINLDGDISTFSPELLAVQSSPYGPLTWGNVHRDTWATFAENPVFKRVNAEVLSGTDKCRRSCEYFAVCGGCDPSNKLAENVVNDFEDDMRSLKSQVRTTKDCIVGIIRIGPSRPNIKYTRGRQIS